MLTGWIWTWEIDITKLARATGARVINNLDDFSAKDLGSADLVEERKVETDKWVFVEGCKHPKSVTILIRGGSKRVIDEADRSVHDTLMVAKDVLEKPAIVAGGGAPEAASKSIGGPPGGGGMPPGGGMGGMDEM